MQTTQTTSTTEQVYKIAKGWAIFIYIFMPLLVGLFIFLGIMPFVIDDFSWTMVAIFVPMSIGMTFFMVYGLIETIKGRFIIKEDRVIGIGAFKTKELKISEIKGFKADQNYIHIVPVSKRLPKIKISQYYGNKQDLNMWLYQNFPDLDVVDRIEDEQEILANNEFGFTVEQRERKLKSAKSFAKILNFMGGVVAFWLFFYPYPYKLATGIALLFPFIVLFGLFGYKGLIRIDQKDNSGYPSLALALMMPSMGLMLRGILDFELLEYNKIWLPVAIMAAMIVLAILFITRELKFKKAMDYFTVLVLMVLMFGYSFGAVMNINCLYDDSTAEYYQAEVLDKRISSGKTTSYYLELEEWGPREVAKEVSVSKSLYEMVEVNEMVDVYLLPGKLQIPWFFVESSD